MNFRLVSQTKDFILFTRLPLLLGFLYKPMRLLVNMIGLSKWIKKHGSSFSFNDFYRATRVYSDREKLYQHVIKSENLEGAAINYLEFGVSGAGSFRWWIARNTHPDSKFFGFDTFEGLPESWFTLKKGAMTANVPDLEDTRCKFIKGLFQHSLYPFISENMDWMAQGKKSGIKIIHMDADLYSSTLFVLTSLAPYLNAGDIIFFDEFNVPNHEYAAWEAFVTSYYVDFEVLGAVNNYYQVAVKYKGMGVFSR